ncbi:MAG: hemolysin [Rhodocyclaceae bacterium]|nr:hemolysin [Rhodocyclaceae bacterium]
MPAPRGPSFPILATCLGAVATIGALAACNRGGNQPPAGMFGGPVPVAVVTVQPEAVPVDLEYAARTLGSREVEVRARVNGILLKRNYAEGGKVKAGQSLFSLDPAPFEAALARAEADTAAAAARHAQARREAERLKPLYEVKAASQKDYDQAVSAQAIAAADLQAAEARQREARLNLSWTRVESPISGIASRALKSEGSLVSGPEVLLTTVTQTDPMDVLFGIPDNERLALQQEVEAGRLRWPRDGRFRATVVFADGSGYKEAGVVNFADVRVSPDTGTSEGRATIPNPAGWLRAGQFVRVRLAGAVREAAFKVPQRAIQEGPQGRFVYVVGKDGKAAEKKVEVGEWSDGNVVVHAGLAPGDRVIVDGVLKLGPGAPIQVAAPAVPARPGS